MEKDITIDDINIHYNETGPEDGSPVILMHGWGCDHTTVALIENTLNPDMHVFNLDLPGHGKSQEPSEPWGIEKFTRLVEEFISRLGIKNPSLIGHSFGGRISILLASRQPVNKVVLVDAAGIKPKRNLKYYIKVYSFKAFKKFALTLFGEKTGGKMVEWWRGKSGSQDYRNSSPMMRRIMSICVNEDFKYVMPDIKAPTLLIWGENDTATPLSYAETMNSLIPDSGLVSFPDAGHYSFLDNPVGFKAVIKEFFKNERNRKVKTPNS